MPSKLQTKTFIVHEEPEIEDLSLWKAGKYAEGDQVNVEDIAMQCRVSNTDKTFDQKKWGVAVNERLCEIRKPGFTELNAALSSMTNMSGDLDFGAGGKVIFETCKVKHDPQFKEENGILMLSLCLLLGNHYLKPYAGEIKKN